MDNLKITDFKTRTVYDSNCNPSIEVELTLNGEIVCYGYAPRGSTKGGFECIQYYENENNYELLTQKSSALGKQLIGFSFNNQRELDSFLNGIDGTENKSRFGGNLLLATSIAGLTGRCRALRCNPSKLFKLEYLLDVSQCPGFMFNLIDGIKDHSSAGLECLLVPTGLWTLQEKVQNANKVYIVLEDILTSKYHRAPIISKQGGYASEEIHTLKQMLSDASNAVEKAGYVLGKDFYLGLDIAAADCFMSQRYRLAWNDDKMYDGYELLAYYEKLTNEFPIIYLEDGFAPTDFLFWKLQLETNKNNLMIAGDDLFATNVGRLEKYRFCANSAVIKPNQIGTISETIDFIQKCRYYDLNTIVSQRTSEIEMNIVSHLAYAFGLDYIKAGGLRRMERISRFNEIIRLSE